MSALDDIRARAEAKPCHVATHDECIRRDRDKLLAAIDAVERYLERLDGMPHGRAADPGLVASLIRGYITKALE